MYDVAFTKRFRKALKKYRKTSGFPEQKLRHTINTLASGTQLPATYQDHKLKGKLQHHRECHIKPNLLLIYKIVEKEKVLTLADLGTHEELFDT